MADSLKTKKLTDLAENTGLSETDLFLVGNAGTANLRRISLKNMVAKLKEILGINSLNTKISSAAHVARMTWGKQLIVSGRPGYHGFVIKDSMELYVVWVAGERGSMEINFKKIWGNADTMSAAFNESTNTLTLTCSQNAGITYIGS